ncbi:hypothetical protein FOMPIDRAFT_1013599 [Fomitopsis schrenkii]|uniref:Uncharacterized protein n=1 Tax=Fomitopsis schrenkii TaxID=2126942 RepID=S8FW44_FOMSC|nr:hypothetical protein FOMPIDRAFT_1013599 [Fomitopsis schrenkii]
MAVQDVLVWVNRGTFKSNVVQNLDLLSKAFVLWGCFLINVRSSALLWHQEKKSPDFNAILHVWLVATFFGGGEYLEDGFDVWGPKLCCDPTVLDWKAWAKETKQEALYSDTEDLLGDTAHQYISEKCLPLLTPQPVTELSSSQNAEGAFSSPH